MKVVGRTFDHAGALGDDHYGVTARLSNLTSVNG